MCCVLQQVMIHYLFDYPDYNAELQFVQLNTQHLISINPWEMYSKPEVRNLAISTRKCIYDDEAEKVLYGTFKERNLSSAVYSYHNCLAECRATVARAKCGCIPYYFPQNSKYNTFCNINFLTEITNISSQRL